jgi:hypothetical protein
MPPRDKGHGTITTCDEELVLRSLERDQLAGLKKQPIPRRHLSGSEAFVIWSLRIYLVFMMGVVLYQVLTGMH